MTTQRATGSSTTLTNNIYFSSIETAHASCYDGTTPRSFTAVSRGEDATRFNVFSIIYHWQVLATQPHHNTTMGHHGTDASFGIFKEFAVATDAEAYCSEAGR